MLSLKQNVTKRLVAVHGWSGVVLGLLLYVVLLTGAVAVFDYEIATWSTDRVDARMALADNATDIIETALTEVGVSEVERLNVSFAHTGEAVVYLHGLPNPDPDESRSVSMRVKIDPKTGEPTETLVGAEADIFEHQARILERFLVDLHVRLHVPEPWGLFLTGILGLVMMVASISGFVIHRHLFKDLFVPERPGKRLVSFRDRHALAGTWGLPFAVVLAFTGTFYSFALSLGLPVVSLVAFGGDREAAIEAVIGGGAHGEIAPAAMTDLNALIARSEAAAGNKPSPGFQIHHWGLEDGEITVFHSARTGGLLADSRKYALATGEYLGPSIILGQQPSAGAAAVELMAPLHFGHFGGFVSKLVWVGLGGALSFVTITGLQLWARKRQDEALWRFFDRVIGIVGYGLPIAMVGAAYGFFLALALGDPEVWTPWAFIIVSGVCIAVGLAVRRLDLLSAIYRGSLGLGCFCLPLVRLEVGGSGWVEALAAGRPMIPTLDVFFFLTGLGYLVWLARETVLAPAVRAEGQVAEPAE
ncbi:MAG: PepSY-associated TM helix domain-containing protein [Pseudomonadota bacterium]